MWVLPTLQRQRKYFTAYDFSARKVKSVTQFSVKRTFRPDLAEKLNFIYIFISYIRVFQKEVEII